MASQTDRGVPLSTLSPKFLHTNSTSHTWPFSAIAELIDNAYDPDVSAKQFWIDKTVVKQEECLIFMDNGNGLDYETMHKMLSFGYSDKIAIDGQEPIGIYGNGFKSGSMRLGKDAIVFSMSNSVSCIGMLSQTYLEEIGAKQIIVPIICIEKPEKNKFIVKEVHKPSLQAILDFSPFKTQEELLSEIGAITSTGSTEKTGTRIIIWNLRRTSTGSTEFDFVKDRYDIRIPSEVYEEMTNDTSLQADRITSYVPETSFSLRAYCSILYLKPRMQIMIRGQKVKSELVAKSLAWRRKDHYKPNFLDKRIPITFGYNTKSKDQFGIMMYHKNRLIKAYERVGCQLKANNKGVGVIGIIECNFLDPTHNKQSFIETDKYRKTINSLAIKLEEYWNEIRFNKTRENPHSTIAVEDILKRPDQNWVQCDRCLKWRKLPDGIDTSKLPELWYCHMNPDPQFRSCQVQEEPEDSDDDEPSYRKTYKQQEREEKKKLEFKKKRSQQLHLAKITKENEKLRRQHEDLERQLRETMQPSTISQAASNNGLPVITNVCSLSASPMSVKRSLPAPPQGQPKRLRVNGFTSATKTPSSVNMGQSTLSLVNLDSDDNTDDTDDDIVILETASTPKPNKSVLNSAKVKKEEDENDIPLTVLMECTDDAAVDVPSETNSAGTVPLASPTVETSPFLAAPLELASITTQTEVLKVKKEEESQNQTEAEESATQNACSNNDEEQHSDDNAHNVEQREVKKTIEDKRTKNEGQQKMQNGETHDLGSDENPGPSNQDACKRTYSPVQFSRIIEVQEQQDQLLQMMEDTAQERDSLKEQVQTLTSLLQEMECKLQEMYEVNLKKECSHKASQTDEAGGKDYKSLFEKAKQKVNEVIQDKAALIAAAETKADAATTAQGDEKDINEIAVKVESLSQELDQRIKERDELRLQLENAEEEKANLVVQCEELRLSLQQQRESTPNSQRIGKPSIEMHADEEGVLADSRAHSSSAPPRSLLELRQNIERLLVSYMPTLDLRQVSYDSNIIDEILEKVYSNMDAFTAVTLRNNRGNE
ncbi:MORC family CW-type zinc finger protein 3a isoform 2-T2 [Pholidichthys leucotaenia]